jgi:SAM-dependent methyltransferase
LLKREVEFIHRSLGNSNRTRILLDACCGSGSVSLSIQPPDSLAFGLDINYPALERFSEQSQRVPLIQGNVLCMPLADVSIDCILAIRCFDQLDRIRFLHECFRVLCAGGLLIFDALNRHSYKWSLKRLRGFFSKNHYSQSREKWINVLSCHEVLHTVKGCGFDVQTIYGYGWIPFTQAGNSILIKPASFIEKAIHLDRLFMISPRFLVAASKNLP